MLVLGHRGSPRHAPENSLRGYRLALREGADGVEADVRHTQDGHLVCLHDSTLERTTDGRGPVAERTFAELRQLRLLPSPGVGAVTPGGPPARVPSLRAALAAVSSAALVDLDVKPCPPRACPYGEECGERLVELLLDELAAHRSLVPVVVTSRDLRVTAHVKRAGLRTGLIAPSLRPFARTLPVLQDQDLDLLVVHASALRRPGRRVRAHIVRSAGVDLLAWAVNDRGAMRHLASLGVKAAITDVPYLLRSRATQEAVY